MRTFIPSFLVAILLAATASAQISLEGGVNMANLAEKAGGDQVKTKFNYMALVGIVADIKMSNHVYFQPYVFYKGDGCKVDVPNSDPLTSTINTATFGFNFEYQSGSKCGSRAFVGVGPFISSILSTDITDPSGKSLLTSTDFGISANVGYRVGKHWYLKITYAQGMSNLLNGGDDKNYIKTMGIGITLGFHMGGCRPRVYGGGGTSGSHHWRGLRNNGHYRKERNYRHWLGY